MDHHCSNCGALLPAPDQNGVAVCEFCKHSSQVEPRPTPPPEQVVHIEIQQSTTYINEVRPIPVPRVRRKVGCFTGCAAVITLGAVAGIAGLILLAALLPAPKHVAQPLKPKPAAAVASGLLKLAPDLELDPRSDLPVLIKSTGGDPVVGCFRRTPTGPLVMAGFRLRWPAIELWRKELPASVKRCVLAAGNDSDARPLFLLWAAPGGLLHIANPDDGQDGIPIKVGGEIEWLCRVPGDRHTWARLANGRSVEIDAESKAVARGTEPAWCKWAHHRGQPGPEPLASPALKLAGYRITAQEVDDRFGLAVASPAHGSGAPELVGFQPVSMDVRWKKPLFPAGKQPSRALTGKLFWNTYVGTYEERPAGTLAVVAVDAEKGTEELRATSKLPMSPQESDDVLNAPGGDAVVVVRAGFLDVFSTGGHSEVATIGRVPGPPRQPAAAAR